MIKQNSPRVPKGVGLISGGLDSTLAAKVMKDLGVDVYGVFFAMPWGCCDKAFATAAAHSIGIKFITLQLDERYLEIVRNPRFGRGTAMNPCIDCRIHMFTRAAQYMRHIGADFVFTGEVIGQRPMSQRREAMRLIEEHTGLQGKLLRPLSAQFLDPTDVEREGLVDRDRLLSLNGRSRKEQLDMAEKFNLQGYSSPAGGCLLTDDNFSRRIKDTFRYGYRNFRETISLKWGRHYRLNKDFKCIAGRDKEENDGLLHFAHPDDIIMQLPDNLGPTLILKGPSADATILALCAGIVQRFSKYKDHPPVEACYWTARNRNDIHTIRAVKPSEEELDRYKV
ncbi:MAG: tRNA 4-thiouridine(8) synthase ThiI [Candidatus Omnitrophica bacterium]|nr:tRNA 4-thiouridine(8) synthase ThiI [Candidatus Omnitrophota bacterium]MCB9722058.1 tRNA 4-thiouridine(8) synthase ThiI [Candidatus Omnitrophota bacterium]